VSVTKIIFNMFEAIFLEMFLSPICIYILVLVIISLDYL